MPSLREAATQSLEAMEHTGMGVGKFNRINAACAVLRAALAEPDWQDLYLKEKKRADMWRDKYESVAGAEQRIHPLAGPIEPVAWSYELATTMLEHGYDGWEHRITRYKPNVPEGSIRNLTPLYTSPPQRKPLSEERNFCSRCGNRTNGIHTCTPPAPLTDEVIAELWHQNGGFHHHFARAIERWLRGHA